MNAPPLTDAAERFPLGARNGFTPTAEPVSDTAVTPFGLTLRVTPTRRNVVRVHGANSDLAMATDKVTLIETDGRGPYTDTEADYVTD